MDNNELKKAFHEWETFVGNLPDEKKNELMDLREAINSTKLFHFAALKESLKFDQAISQLSNRYLFDIKAIPTIYNFYNERGLYSQAFDYINKALQFLQDNGEPIDESIKTMVADAASINLLSALKSSLVNIRSLQPKDVVHVTPDVINNKRNLSEFILNEIVQASKILLEKIEAAKEIKLENRYNNLLLAILRLRFPIWGWSIHEESPMGTSPSKKGPGETDITIQAGNVTFALCEALNLTGKNRKVTQKHITKCFGYSKNLDRYYIIIYYKGRPQNFDATWKSYQQDVRSCQFPKNLLFKKVKDLSSEFEDSGHLKIAKTIHGSNLKVEMYHIIINLS